MGLRLVIAVVLLAAGLVVSASEHDVHKRQAQYPQRGRPAQRVRSGYQVAPASEGEVPEYVEQPPVPQQTPRQARVVAGGRVKQQPSFTVTDEVDHQPPDYDQEAPGPRFAVTTADSPPTPSGPKRRRPQSPARQPEVLRGPSLTQQDLSPISYATPRRQVKPPVPNRVATPASSYLDGDQEEPAPPVPPPASTVLLAQGPPPSPPPFNFGGAVLVTENKPEVPALTTRPQRGRGAQRRPAASRTTSPATTEALPPSPTPPVRRAGARRPVVRLQNTQANPTPPPPPSPTPRSTPRLTTRRPAAAVPYNPDSNLAPPPDEEEFNQPIDEPKAVSKFTRKPTEATTEGEEHTPPPPSTTTRRPGGKRLKIGTLPSRPTTTTTTTEAPVEEYDDYDDQPPPPPRRSSGTRNTRRGSAPKPAVVFEEPSESQEEVSKHPVRGRITGRPTNKVFRPRPADDYDDDYEDTKPRPSTRSESSRPAGRGRVHPREEEDDYDDGGEYRERLYRFRDRKTSGGRYRGREGQGARGRGPTTSPKPTRRTPPKDLPKRKDGRIIDYLGDPNFPRELNGYDLTEYPFYISLPDDVGNFDCEERANGFYASVPHQCQVFHYCFGGNRFSFLCANYTLYDQTTFTCQFANKVNCVTSELYYSRNDDLYKEDKDKDKKDEKKSEEGEEEEEVEEDEVVEEEKEVKAPSRGGNSRGATTQTKNKTKS